MVILSNILFLEFFFFKLVSSLFGYFIDFLIKLIQLVIIRRLIQIIPIMITTLIVLILAAVLVFIALFFVLEDNVI